MYIIEFSEGVYSAAWKGDPGRTLKKSNAQRSIGMEEAAIELDKILKDIKGFRQLPLSRVVWLDEISGKISPIMEKLRRGK